MLINIPKLAYRVRGADAGSYPENREEEQVHCTSLGDQIQAHGLPPAAEIVRLGESWQMLGAASTGLTAIPTTAGLLQLWNGEPANGKCYVIDSVTATKVIIDVTTHDLFTVWAQLLKAPQAAPTDAALAIRSLSGKYSYGGRARSVATATTLANRWDPIGQSAGQASAIAGSAWMQLDIPLKGQYVITPGSSFTLHASEVTATASTFRFCIRWHEVQIPFVN